MKKLLTLLFAAALTLSLSSVSFAQDTASADKKDDAKTETKAEKKASKKAKKSKKDKAEKTDDMKKDDMAK
jgi:hypothetical protein